MKCTYQNRSCFVGAFLGIALVAGLVCLPSGAWGWVDMSRVCHVGDTWYVTPSCDVERDCDTVQYAVDNAVEGETILLKRGIFDFGVLDETVWGEGRGILVNGENHAKNLTIKGETWKCRWGPKKGEVLFWMTVIRGGGGTVGAIQLADSKLTMVEGLWLYEPFRFGIIVGSLDRDAENHGAVIRNNRVTNVREIVVGNEFFSGAIAWWGAWYGSYLIEGNLIDDNWWYERTQFGPFDSVRDADIEWNANRNAFFFKAGVGDLILRKNTIRCFEGIGVQIWSGGRGLCTIEGNKIGLKASEYNRFAGLEVQTFHDIIIRNNRIKAARGFTGTGIKVAGFRHLPPPSCVVTGNLVQMGSGESGIQLGITNGYWNSPLVGAEVSDNKVKGEALYGYRVEHGDGVNLTTLNTVEVTNLKRFRSLEADIYCGPMSVENTFLIEDLDELTVVDDGVDNVFVDLD